MSAAQKDDLGTNESTIKVGSTVEQVDRALPFDPTVFSGSKNMAFSEWLGEQVINCHYLPAGLDEVGHQQRVEGMLAQLAEIGPRNGLEGMLAGQMVAMHGAGCDLLRRAMQPTTQAQVAEALMRTSTRMMTLFARQTELLLRLRGREKQTLRIEHVRKAEDGRVSVTAEAERAGTA